MVCKWHYLLDGCWRSSRRGENPNDRWRPLPGTSLPWAATRKSAMAGALEYLGAFWYLGIIYDNQKPGDSFWYFLGVLLLAVNFIGEAGYDTGYISWQISMYVYWRVKDERSTSSEVSVFQDNQCPKTCWVRVSSPATFSSSSTWWFKSLLWKTAIWFQDLHIKHGDCPEGKQINHHLCLLAINLIDYSIKQFLKF